MKVSEIAKSVGKDNAEVAEHFGIETTQGFWNREVDDAEAANYLAASVSEPSEGDTAEQAANGRARFWCKGRFNVLAGDDKTDHDTIAFDEWAYECADDSAEAKLLRVPSAWARFGIAEVYPRPYTDAGKRADLIRFVEDLLYTGAVPQDGVSREGHKCAAALLWPGMEKEIPKTVKNRPDAFARAIAEKISLSVPLGLEGK